MNAWTDLFRSVRELPERTGLTQEKFTAKLGVTFPIINRWKHGRAKPSPLAMQKIEALLRTMDKNSADLLQQYL